MRTWLFSAKPEFAKQLLLIPSYTVTTRCKTPVGEKTITGTMSPHPGLSYSGLEVTIVLSDELFLLGTSKVGSQAYLEQQQPIYCTPPPGT